MDRRCAYLTMEDPAGWSIDAELGFPPMETMGWRVESLPWRTPGTDWDRFDAVYIGRPWDYPQEVQHFMHVLASIDRSRAILVNDIDRVRWTIPKTYLRDLENRGVAIVPSIWGGEMDAATLESALNQFAVDRIVVKPVISSNATDTFVLERNEHSGVANMLAETFSSRDFVIQPFIENIQREGEYSLFYFNRRFSHAVQMVPRCGDFRVQEEYGADIVSIEPEAALLEVGRRVMQMVAPLPVYARTDFVRGPDGGFLLMELELIEPSMYLRMDRAAPLRFATAFDEYVSNVSGRL